MKVGDKIITHHEHISEHVVNHFKVLFDNVFLLHEDSLVEEVIHKLVNDQTNNLLTMLPSKEKTHKATFSLNKDNVPGPDGFGPILYQTY